MFLMMGINDGRKDLNFSQMLLCGHCGRYGNCQVFMTFTVLWLFFIPIARWNKHYYVQMSCCNVLYELDPQVGKQIARGKDVKITQADLTYINPGSWDAGYTGFGGGWSNGYGGGWSNGYGDGWNSGHGNGWNNGNTDQNYGNGSGYGNAGYGWKVSGGNDPSGNGNGETDAGSAGGQKSGQRRCPSCGAMVDRSFAYCPHCGQRLG